MDQRVVDPPQSKGTEIDIINDVMDQRVVDPPQSKGTEIDIMMLWTSVW